MAEINDELRVLVTAEVEKAIKNLKDVDNQTDKTTKAFKILGKTISAAFVTRAVVDFSAQSVAAQQEHIQTSSILKTTLEATGATAWTTAKQLQDMAKELQHATNYTSDSINQMQAILLGFRNIQGENFTKATRVILNAATTMHQNIDNVAQGIGKALDDPIHGMDSLSKQGFKFTESQKKVMQSLIDTGDAAAAQKYVLDELDKTYGESAKAAANSAIQIKNAYKDLQEGVGGFLTGFVSGDAGKNAVTALEYLADAFGSFHENIAFLKAIKSEAAYNEWYATLVPEKKVEAAAYKINELSKAIKGLKDGSLGDKFRDELIKNLNLRDSEWKEILEGGDEALVKILSNRLEIWTEERDMLNAIAKYDQDIQATENERAAIEDKIKETMLEVSKNYDKLASDEPTVQLQKYLKKLEEIEKQRRELSQSALDSDGNLIDTSEAMRQLDVLEKNIKKKIENLEIDGKKSWQNWLSEILGIDKKLFTTGKQAAELYLSGVETSIESAEGISKALGEKFSKSDFLESQLEEIKSKIQEALTVDPSKITESFSLDELSKESSALGELAKKYKELKEAKGEAAAAEEIKRLEKEVANLGKTERELYLIQLEENGATKEQIERAKELRETLDRYKDLDSFDSLSEKIGYMTEQWLISLDAVDEKTAKVIGNLTAALSQVGFDSVVSGAEEFGKALGKGEDGAEAMQKAMASMAKQILKQLPMLFVNAGLTLIAQGQWPIGLGFIFGGLADAVISGLVEGATENAKGGVYGDSGYSAFAKGGAFTNQIVTKPTYFKFAKGSGFGTGLMGEAGPEAIMPLTRGADGSLGVTASGLGGSNVEINIPVTVYSDEPVEVHDEEDDSGQRKIEILVGSMINNHISNGKADKALKNRFGLKAQGI